MTPDPQIVAGFYAAAVGWQIATQAELATEGSDYPMITRAAGGHAGGALTKKAQHEARPVALSVPRGPLR